MKSTREEENFPSTHTAEAERVEGVTFGKFKDPRSLVRAYESLEAEFTRRSQRLKQLERESQAKGETRSSDPVPFDATGGNDDAKEIFLKRFPRAKALSSEIAAFAVNDNDFTAGNLERAYARLLEREIDRSENKLNDRDFLIKKIREDPTVANEIVKSYLKDLASAKPKVAFGGGTALAMPPRKPKNLEEAATMTQKYFNEKGEIKW
ncbi:MAG: hypothetical protein IJ800_05115 [Clostridia bacterium]|nr:hypothetical protein [Clostridia bacterium]